MTTDLTVYIIAGNEQHNIADCLRSVRGLDCPVLLTANNSHDQTVSIAIKTTPKITIIRNDDQYNRHFAKWRNVGLPKISTGWVFYLDADERLTPQLTAEIKETISQTPPAYQAYAIPRANHFLGQPVRWGNTSPDYVKRLFYLPAFTGFTGTIHEEPVFDGQLGHMRQPILHFTHTSLSQMTHKTISWTDIQAQTLASSHHPPIVWWRFFRMAATKFFERFIRQKIFLDSTVGWISGIFEIFDTLFIYSRLWEIQNEKPRHL